MVHELATMKEALALGDITAVEDDVSLLLTDFQINLDRKSASYRELGMQAQRAYVRALQAIDKRNTGEPIETPKFFLGPSAARPERLARYERRWRTGRKNESGQKIPSANTHAP